MSTGPESGQLDAGGQVLVNREDLKIAAYFLNWCAVLHPSGWRDDITKRGREAHERIQAVLAAGPASGAAP
jgi:hypothetical protein